MSLYSLGERAAAFVSSGDPTTGACFNQTSAKTHNCGHSIKALARRACKLLFSSHLFYSCTRRFVRSRSFRSSSDPRFKEDRISLGVYESTVLCVTFNPEYNPTFPARVWIPSRQDPGSISCQKAHVKDRNNNSRGWKQIFLVS